ncbi:MAG: phenylacetate--CoA ligase family protein [Phycisphaerae bacterium]
MTRPHATHARATDAAALWDPRCEAMSPSQLHETVELPRLRQQLRHAVRHSPFWRDRFAAAGLTAGDFDEHAAHDGATGVVDAPGPARCAGGDGAAVLARLHTVPLLDKQALLDDQRADPPYGRLPAVPRARIRRVHRTSGTTSRPFFALLTERDIATTVEAGARAFWCAGVRPDDTVVHCLNYCMWSGGVTDHQCLERTGATVVPYGVGRSRELVRIIQTLKPTAISCTPSYLYRLAEVLAAEFDVAPAALGLRKGLLGGEAGLQHAGTRDALERAWGIEAVDANYGMSDVLSIFGSECAYRTGLHFHGQGIILPELIDPHTAAAVPMRAGVVAELVLTHLQREAQPVIRLRTRDVVKIVGTDACACGRRGPRFVVLGRSDDMLVVNGVNVFPTAFGDVLAAFPGELTGAYRVAADQGAPCRRVHLKVEVRPTVGSDARAALARRLQARIRDTLSVGADITWVGGGCLERSEGKTRLVEHAVCRAVPP